MTAEAEVLAPRADAMLHVLRMHVRAFGDSPGRSSSQIETLTVLALIEDYQPDAIPQSFIAAFSEALDSLVIARRHHIDARLASPIIAARHHRDLEAQAENEARRIIRHKITLEGNDL